MVLLCCTKDETTVTVNKCLSQKLGTTFDPFKEFNSSFLPDTDRCIKIGNIRVSNIVY